MNQWKEISASALVGLERKPWSAPAGESPVERLLAQLAGEAVEDTLLRAAAVLRQFERAGRLPAAGDRTLPAVCPADSRQRCGPRATQHLRSLLAGTYKNVLPEWLSLVAAAGLRVPEECLVPVFQMQLRESPALVAAACGERGQWLALQHPEFAKWWRGEKVEASWETGTHEERQALLRLWRNQTPEVATRKIASTWNEDKAEHKRDFLLTLRTGLSLADEPFLENALDDKSVVVRRAAADLLARVAGSRLVERVAAILRPSVAVTSKGILFARKNVLSLQMLERLTPALVRDGIQEKGAPPGMGEKAWWTFQCLGVVPPSVWCDAFALKAEELVEAAANGEDGAVTIEGWAWAAVRHGDADWAKALLSAPSPPINGQAQLFELLPPADRETVALAGAKPQLARLLLAKHPWSREFTRAVWPALGDVPLAPLKELAAYASPEIVDELPKGLTPPLESFAEVLRFRRAMRRAIENRE